MKIQKKLLFLLCMAFISGSCYGMLDEEVPKVRMDYYEKFASNQGLTIDGKVHSKPLYPIENSLFPRQLNLFSRNANNNNFISRLARKIEALRIDSFKAVPHTNEGPVYDYSLVDGTELLDEINEHVQSQIDIDRKKRLYFWEHHPIFCINLAFLAGGLTLKLYNTFYGKQ